MDTKYVREVLRITSENDYIGYIHWTVEPYVKFFVICSDTFAYACADSEEILESDIELFEECLKADEIYGYALFVAAKRKIMPIREVLQKCDKDLVKLFKKYSGN